MKKKKETRGRKAIPNNQKVVPITFYVSPEIIKAIGGVEKAREECKEFLIGLSQLTSGSMNGIYYGGALLDVTTYDAVNIISSSGNISGTAWVYGFAK